MGTDLPGAANAGVASLFVTGGLAGPELGPDPEAPDPVLLDAYLERHGARPAAVIGRLR